MNETKHLLTHECPREGCPRRVTSELLACSRHWYSVTNRTRIRVWKAFRDHGPGSDEHLAAITQAITEMNEAPL